MQLMLDPAFLTHGTPQEYVLWSLVAIAILLLWRTIHSDSGILLMLHLIVIGILVYIAMSARPAHGQPYPRPRPEIVYSVPIPKPRPAMGRNEVCDNQCMAIGKQPGCKEKRLCYQGITR